MKFQSSTTNPSTTSNKAYRCTRPTDEGVLSKPSLKLMVTFLYLLYLKYISYILVLSHSTLLIRDDKYEYEAYSAVSLSVQSQTGRVYVLIVEILTES